MIVKFRIIDLDVLFEEATGIICFLHINTCSRKIESCCFYFNYCSRKNVIFTCAGRILHLCDAHYTLAEHAFSTLIKQTTIAADGEKPFEEKDKTVLIEKGQNHFDILPEGWIQVTHNSGMPLYLHKPSRVCTFAKPYFLGSGSARVSIEIAIMCLRYN